MREEYDKEFSCERLVHQIRVRNRKKHSHDATRYILSDSYIHHMGNTSINKNVST